MNCERFNHTKYICIALCVFALTACTVIPGSHINHGQLPQTQELTAKLDVNLFPISAKLVNQLRKQAKKEHVTVLSTSAGYLYRVGVGDVLTIVVWEHPKLTNPLGLTGGAGESGNVVRADGTIYFPYAGNLTVAGLTVNEIRQKLTDKLNNYIETPQVDVRIAQYNSQHVLITGGVGQPAVLPIKNTPLHVLEALNLAGDILPTADIHNVTLNRGGKEYPIPLYALLYQGESQYNVLLQHGDVVHVDNGAQNQVYLLGEVNQPQSIVMPHQPLSLTSALAQVNGLNKDKADASAIYVIRRAKSDEQVNIYHLDMQQAYQLILANQFELQSQDIVYVSAAPISRWNRVLNNILPTFTGLSSVSRIGN